MLTLARVFGRALDVPFRPVNAKRLACFVFQTRQHLRRQPRRQMPLRFERLFQYLTQLMNPDIRLPLTEPKHMPLDFLKRISLQIK